MSMHRLAAPTLALIPVLALTGCGWLVGPVCVDTRELGLLVSVVDSITGGPVVTENEVVAIDGSYADTATATLDRSETQALAGLATERPGTYHVETTAEGYRPWAKDGVRVSDGECHVQTVELEALMQPVEGL